MRPFDFEKKLEILNVFQDPETILDDPEEDSHRRVSPWALRGRCRIEILPQDPPGSSQGLIGGVEDPLPLIY